MSGHPGGIAGSGFRSNRAPISIAVPATQDCGPRPAPEGERRFDGLETGMLPVALDPEEIAGDVTLSPYWNGCCAEMQSMWWLPHRTASPGPPARSSGTSSNFREEASNFWKRTIVPTNSTCDASLRISLPSETPVTASVLVKGTRKIRAFPKNSDLLMELVRQQRRAYNLSIACFREVDEGLVDPKEPDLKRTALRATIRDFVRSEVQERGGTFRSADCDEAVNAAFRARDAVIRRRSRGERCSLSFRSIKDIRQRIAVQKLSAGFVAQNFDLAEPMPDEAWRKLTTIVLERGMWFICAQKHIVTVGQDEIQVRSVVALDPGVRSFVTAYSVNHAASYGDGFHSGKVFPLLLQLDRLIGQRAKAKHDEWKRHFQKRIDKLFIRVRNLVDDLHRRVAYDLVQKFDVILLPSFETKGMSAKEDRRIRTKTVRSMLGLAHHRFRQKLEWMCRKYGKRLVICNEAYTSRTCSWDGFVNENLGGAKTVSDGSIVVDRDINGARGIMLRALYGNLGHFRAAGADVAPVAE
ncbi:MAG: transposase [Boseongicola sp.]|nr:transposase [Boseongicola sp.]